MTLKHVSPLCNILLNLLPSPMISPTAHFPSPTLPSSSTAAPDRTTSMAAAPTITLVNTSQTPAPFLAQATAAAPIASTSTRLSDSITTAAPEVASVSKLLPNMNIVPKIAPAPSAPITGTPLGDPVALGNEVGTRRHRIRKAHVLQLNACTCGVTITDLEIQEGKTVMKCHAPGCETVWVSVNVTYDSIILLILPSFISCA
jgi:hypothetical protein